MTQKPRMRADSSGQLKFADSLTNVVSGLGTERDKRSSNQFIYSTLDRQNLFELEAAYSTNWLARAVVDYPVDDATREWRYFSCEEASDIQRGEKRYRVQQHVQEGFKWARLYGGAVIVMVTDQDMSQPLDVTRIGKGSLKRLVTVDRKYITGLDYNYTDPTAPNYLLPNYYMVYGGSLRIHHSHIVRIPGERVPLSIRQVNGGWDDSALRKCLEDIKDAVSSKAGIASLIQEANVDVIQREGLSDELSTEDGSSAIIKRYQLAGTLKAINRMLLLDGDETYNRNPASFGGLGEILGALMEWVSGAADIPMTRLFGIQSKGIGDSGGGDEKNYLNAIKGKQESDYRDVLEQLDEVMIRSTLGDMPEECEFEWNPLSQPSGVEQAQQDLAHSQADSVYLADGVLKRSQVARRLQSLGSYPVDDAHIEELEKAEQEEAEGMFELPEEPEPRLPATDSAFGYVSVRPSPESARAITEHVRSLGIKDAIDPDDLHVTLMYSRGGIPKATDRDVDAHRTHKATLGSYDIIGEDPWRALVVDLSSDSLNDRHEEIKRLGAVHSYPEFRAHMSVKYNPTEEDLDKLSENPVPVDSIILAGEKWKGIKE